MVIIYSAIGKDDKDDKDDKTSGEQVTVESTAKQIASKHLLNKSQLNKGLS